MKIRLREILKERSLTLKAFSEISGISQPNLSNYINGKVSPTLDMLNRIADSLGIQLTELFEKSDPIEFHVKYNGNIYNISTNDIVNILKSKSDDEIR